MTENNNESPLVILEKERDLPMEITSEMYKGYDLIKDVIEKLLLDTRIEEVMDMEGKIIGQRTHIHPQLIKWIRESRMIKNDMWKMGGGELQQEAEKKMLDVKAKIIMRMVGKNQEKFDEAKEKWKQNRSFKK